MCVCVCVCAYTLITLTCVCVFHAIIDLNFPNTLYGSLPKFSMAISERHVSDHRHIKTCLILSAIDYVISQEGGIYNYSVNYTRLSKE